jgi:hypothetical protein
MRTPSSTNWRKSSRSGAGGNNCVEVGFTPDAATTGIRDTKDRRHGTLSVSADAWAAFLSNVKTGGLDR